MLTEIDIGTYEQTNTGNKLKAVVIKCGGQLQHAVIDPDVKYKVGQWIKKVKWVSDLELTVVLCLWEG